MQMAGVPRSGPGYLAALAARAPILLPALLSVFMLNAQEPIPVLRPGPGATADLSQARFAEFAEFDSLLNTEGALSPLGQQRLAWLYANIGETKESPCDIIGMECSWYCGGGPDSVWASSALGPMGENTASNAHDLDYCTAWSEGVPGPGIGERLTYRFAPDSPRISAIIVVNGLVRDSAQWEAHHRVRRLRVSENGKPLVELDLLDDPAEQVFKLPQLLGRRSDGLPLVLQFTILATHPGGDPETTSITEIFFDGTDVH